jgi:uroporphyrinogen-III decarboxylase
MNAKERLTAAIKGEKVDRQPVCFYEINGFTQDADDSNPFKSIQHIQ